MANSDATPDAMSATAQFIARRMEMADGPAFPTLRTFAAFGVGQGVNGSSSQQVLSNWGRLALSAVACVNAAASASRMTIVLGQVWPRRRRLTGRVATGMGLPLWKPS